MIDWFIIRFFFNLMFLEWNNHLLIYKVHLIIHCIADKQLTNACQSLHRAA